MLSEVRTWPSAGAAGEHFWLSSALLRASSAALFPATLAAPAASTCSERAWPFAAFLAGRQGFGLGCFVGCFLAAACSGIQPRQQTPVLQQEPYSAGHSCSLSLAGTGSFHECAFFFTCHVSVLY